MVDRLMIIHKALR